MPHQCRDGCIHQDMCIELLTVKMILKVTFVVMCLFFPQAKGLECITCSSQSGSCSGNSQQCPTLLTDSCASITAATFVGSTKVAEINSKSCFPSAQCLNGSLNLGSARVTLSTLCCNTDNCNTQKPPAVVNDTVSGRQCFTCGLTDCSSRLECVGDQDRCLTARVETDGQSVAVKGCVSRNICSGSFSAQLDSVAVELNCCEGDLCNRAWSAGHSGLLLLLLCPLVSLLLSH